MAETAEGTTSEMDSEEGLLGFGRNRAAAVVPPPPKLRVVPKKISFEVAEPGVLYGETIVIKNVDSRTHVVRLRQPENRAVWSVEPPTMNVKLAPGIETTLQVFFCTDEVQEFSDELQIASQYELVVLPLEARVPAPAVRIEGDLDFGVTVNETTTRKTFRLVNDGTAEAEFKCAMDKSSALQLIPMNGTIPPKDVQVVEAVFKPTELGAYTTPVEVDLLDGNPKLRNDVSAQVVSQGFELLKGDGNGGPLRKLMFGPVFYDDTSTVHAEVFNNGPTPTRFKVNLNAQKDAETVCASGDVEEEEDEQAREVPDPADGYEEEGAHFLKPPEDSSIQCFPKSGPIGPYEKVQLTFIFSPSRTEDGKGFHATKPTLASCATESVFLCAVQFAGFRKKLRIPVIGKGVQPGVKITPDKVRFGEVAMNRHADCVVLLENESEDLTVRYSFGRGTFFTVHPPAGTMAPSSTCSAIVTYSPRGLGKHSSKIPLEVLSPTGLVVQTLGLSCKGHCGAHTKLERRVLKGGTDMLPEDFQRERHFVEEGGFPSTKPRFKRTATLDKPEHIERITGLVADKNTLAYEEQLRKTQHRDKWGDYLTVTRRAREAKMDLTEKRRRGVDPVKMAMDPISLGLDSHSGLESPRLDCPDPKDPLFQVPTELAGGAIARPRNRPAYQLDDGTVTLGTFKTKPETQEEMRDCIAVLGTHEITKLVCGPPVLDFGKICAMAHMKKRFAITNNLSKSIYIKLNVDGLEDINAAPSSQVVPPGETAGLGVMLCVAKVQQKYKQLVTYSLNNGMHTYAFEVHAEVVPVNLQLDRETIIFKFSADNWQPFVLEPVTITNQNTYPADFHFEVPGPAFLVEPVKGTVDAKSSLHATIRWEPSKLPNGNECSITLRVEGATTHRSIRCQGENPEGKCQFREKSVDLKEISVGVPSNRFLTLKNTGAGDSFFLFDLPKSPNYTVQVSPERGRLTTGMTTEIELVFEASQAGVYDLQCLLNVRGGKTVKLPVRAEAIVPRVSVQQDEFNFDKVYIGGSRSLPCTLANDSAIVAEMELDLRHYGSFSLDLPKENWSTSDYEDCPVVRLSAAGAPVRTPDMRGLDQKRVAKGGKEPEGDRYAVSIVPNKSLTFDLVFRPQVVSAYAFELPLVLTGYTMSDPSCLNKVVVAEALRPKLLVSSTVIDFESRIVLNERVKKIPYTVEITFTNNDVQPLEWVLGKPSSALPQGTKNIFKVEPKEGTLEAEGSQCTLRITFLPREAVNYSMQVPLFIRSQMDKEYVSIKMTGMGTFPRLAFSEREVELPAVPTGVTSVARFFVMNHGYDNLELKYKLPADTSKIPLKLAFPEGRMIGIAKQLLPVELSFASEKPMTFTGTVEFIDEDGNRFGLAVTGTTDNCILTNAPFILKSEENSAVDNTEDKPITLPARPANGKELYEMPSTLWDLDWPTKSLIRWINVMDVRVPITGDIPSAMVFSRGQRMIELVEYVSGKSVPGKTFKLSSNKKEQAEQMVGLYDRLLMHLKSFGALLNDVKPELLIDLEDFRRLIYTMEQRVRMSDQPTVEGDMLPHWVKIEENWAQVSAGAWMKLIHQVVKVFVLCRVTPKQFKLVPGVDPSEMGLDATLAGSNVYSVSEMILLKWMTSHFKRALPQNFYRVSNFGVDMSNGLVLYSLLVCHWPSLDSYFPKMHKPPKTQRQVDENNRLVREMLASLTLTWDTPDVDELNYPDPREMLVFVLYLYQTLPQLIPKTTIEFSGLLGQPMVKTIELTNPSNREISYSVRLEGSRMFQLGDVLVRLAPKSSQEFEVRCTPRTSRGIAGRLVFTSRKEAGAQAATLVFGLVCHTQSLSPIRSFNIESRLYEMNQLVVEVENPYPADCDFVIKLQQEMVKEAVPEPEPEDPRAARRNSAQKEKKRSPTPVLDFEASPVTYPHAFGLDRRGLRMKEEDTISLTACFLPFNVGKHRVHIKFTSEEFGDFVYEIMGEATMPVTTHTFKLQAENQPNASIMKEVFLPFPNQSLDTAKRLFIEKHPLNKQKEQGDLIRNPKDTPKELVYTVESTSSLITTMPTVTLFNIAQEKSKKVVEPKKENQAAEGGKEGAAAGPASNGNIVGGAGAGQASSYVVPPNTLVLSLKCLGPGTYPGTLILKSAADVRVVELEFVVTPSLMTARLEFQCAARQTIKQDIPLVNSSEKQITVMARLSGQCFSGKPSIVVNPKCTEHYPLYFSPTWLGDYSGDLTLQIANSHEGNVYQLKGTAEEPLAEAHFVVQCTARESVVQEFEVPNIMGAEVCDYTVYSDLGFVSGEDEFSVPAQSVGSFELTLKPFKSATTHGTVTCMTPSGRYVWFSMEVRAVPPAVEDTIAVTCQVRKAVLVHISLTNPVKEHLEFHVNFSGHGVFGLDHLRLGPEETKQYELVFSPLITGMSEGSVHFVNELAGEYWYKLQLQATEAPPETLPEMSCEIGTRCTRQVTVDNPLDELVTLTTSSSNSRNFCIKERDLVLQPFGSAQLTVEYTPSSLTEVENGEVAVSGAVMGKVVYKCSGCGLPPSKMEETEVAAVIRQQQSSYLNFMNPFPSSLQVNIRIETEHEQGIFTLMVKRTRNVTVAPFSSLQIPFSFCPESMATHVAEIVVEAEGVEVEGVPLCWIFPIKGSAEVAPSGLKTPTFHFSTKARTLLVKEMEVQLNGLADNVSNEPFTHKLIIPETERSLLRKALTIEALDKSITGPNVPLRFKVSFEPQKVCRTKVDFVVNKNSGGRWRFELQLEATEPDLDGTIFLEAETGGEHTEILQIANPFPTTDPVPFTAYMSADTPVREFTVYPEEGALVGDTPVMLEVTYAPFEFGKHHATGRLIVQTEDMQWLYNLQGSIPKYKPPTGASKIRDQQTLRLETKRFMAEAPSRIQAKNHVRDNLKPAANYRR